MVASHPNVAAFYFSPAQACKITIRQNYFAAQAVMAFLIVKIILVSLIGNGLFYLRSLQSVSMSFFYSFSNLAVVDFAQQSCQPAQCSLIYNILYLRSQLAERESMGDNRCLAARRICFPA